MKIYLTKSIKGIGREGEVKNFPDGYAQNFIIRKGFGIVATPEVIKKASEKKLQQNQALENAEQKIVNTLAKLNGHEIKIKVQANEYGSLFSSIHKKDILNEIRLAGGGPINEQMFELDEPIKKTGQYPINLKYKIYSAKIKLMVQH